MKFHISKRNIVLIIILSIAIFTFSSLGSVKEGYKNKHKKRCNKKHKEEEECNSDNNIMDMSGSYVAPAGNTVLFGIDMEESMGDDKNYNKNKYNKDSLGIPGSDIPDGDEDLYILKSEVVPPVCPACPNVTVCPKNNNNKPPPCPPCGRCPEPAFECKKVPNYNSNSNSDMNSDMNSNGNMNNGNMNNNNFKNINYSNSSYSDFLPRPVLTDFSQFGM
jgi:hypothetical protein